MNNGHKVDSKYYYIVLCWYRGKAKMTNR